MSRGENITLEIVPAINYRDNAQCAQTHRGLPRAQSNLSKFVLSYVPARRKYEAWDIPRIHQYSAVLFHNHLNFIHCQHTIRVDASALLKA